MPASSHEAGGGTRRAKHARMATRKRVHKTSPKTPSRVKKRRKKSSRAHHQRPELVGLGLAGLGVFLAAVLWFGFSGGPVAHAVQWCIGAAAYLTPLVLIPLGALMVFRSSLVDVGPFRLGLPVAVVGLLMALGRGHGGIAGRGFAGLVGLGIGSTGATILGVLLTIAGVLLLTGASLGAWARRGHSVVKTARRRVRERRPAVALPLPTPNQRDNSVTIDPPIDVAHDYPDLVSESIAGPPPMLFDATNEDVDPEEPTQETLFDTAPPPREYSLPDASVLKRSKAGSGPNGEATSRVAEALVTCLAHFGVEATVVGQIAGPRVTRYELQLAPGTKVGKVAQ